MRNSRRRSDVSRGVPNDLQAFPTELVIAVSISDDRSPSAGKVAQTAKVVPRLKSGVDFGAVVVWKRYHVELQLPLTVAETIVEQAIPQARVEPHLSPRELGTFDATFGAEKDDQLAMQARFRVTRDFCVGLHDKVR
jgi:hypothetical protein